MQPRMDHPAFVVPGAYDALVTLNAAAEKADVPKTIHKMAHLRASQINGCSYCVELHARELRNAGESEERISTVAAWREAAYFTDAERAALALTEAMTRISDRPNPVPDEIWDEARRHFEEPALASLLVSIAMINVWNRLNVASGQVAGAVAGAVAAVTNS